MSDIQPDNITNEDTPSDVGQPDNIEESDTKQSNENQVPQLDKSNEEESEFLVFEKSCQDIKYLIDLDKNFIDYATTTIDRATGIIEGCETYDRGQMLTGIDDDWIKKNKLSYGANASVFNLGNENVLRLTYHSRKKIAFCKEMKSDEKKKYYNEFLEDEYRGLFIQGILASKCQYINKVYEIGTYKNKNQNNFGLNSPADIIFYGNQLPLRNKGIYGILEHVPNSFREFKNQRNFEMSKKQATIQLLTACQCIHNNGFVHLDLKPDNIMFDKNWNLKIIDFGYSEVILKPKTTVNQGTEPYQCPKFNQYKTYRKYLDYNAIGYIIMQIWYNGYDWDQPDRVLRSFTPLERVNKRVDFFLGQCSKQEGKDIQEIIDFYVNNMKFPTTVQKAVGAIKTTAKSLGTAVNNSLFRSKGGRRISRRCKKRRTKHIFVYKSDRTKPPRKRKTK